MIKRLTEIATSRRVWVTLTLGLLFALRWRFAGQPSGEDIVAFVGLMVAWVGSDANRRAESLAGSSRFLAMLIGQVVPALLAVVCAKGWLCVELPAGVVATLAGLCATHIVGESVRRHEGPTVTDDEDVPAPADGGARGVAAVVALVLALTFAAGVAFALTALSILGG